GRQRTSLSQVNQQSDINDLTVKQLKEILAANFVNYKGCCEKWELIDRVTRLWKEDRNNQLRGKIPSSVISLEEHEPMSAEGDDLCKVCMAAIIDCVLLDCGHMVTCTKCGKRMAECPMCRQYVVRVVHTFRA
ncbi:E3 ubiquitin-protein ligase RNF34, partial [Lamellibrachia satsuma]